MGTPIHFRYGDATFCAMETIGQRIRQKRLELGIARQSDLAALVGIDQSTVSDIERGAGMRPELLFTFAEVLKTTVEWLVKGKESVPVNAPKGWPLKTLTYAQFVALPGKFHEAVENFAAPHLKDESKSAPVGRIPQNVIKGDRRKLIFLGNKLQDENDGAGNRTQPKTSKRAPRKSAGHRK